MTDTGQRLPVYTAAAPRTPDRAQLRAAIPGWGADLDPGDRPSVPKLRYDLDTGAHWDLPERQPELLPRERSIEHRELTPVFGTAQPLGGLAGPVRRLAYRYSEGRAAHWLLLLFADRVDVASHRVTGLLSGRPDDPVAETGVRTELHGGAHSRVGRGRSDIRHTWMDPAVVTAPWLALAVAAVVVLRRRR